MVIGQRRPVRPRRNGSQGVVQNGAWRKRQEIRQPAHQQKKEHKKKASSLAESAVFRLRYRLLQIYAKWAPRLRRFLLRDFLLQLSLRRINKQQPQPVVKPQHDLYPGKRNRRNSGKHQETCDAKRLHVIVCIG